MKKKKKEARPPIKTKKTNENSRKRIEYRKKMLARKKAKEIKESNAVFRKRLKEFPVRRAPKTLRTKGFYRFTKDFPDVVDAEGFRENSPAKQKLGAKKRTLVFLLCTAVFCISFISVYVGISISERPGNTDYLATDTEAGDYGIHALHFTYDDLRSKGPAELKLTLENNACNTALFEFKDTDGYVTFPVEEQRGSAADRVIDNAWDTVKALEESNIRTAAYISCFCDSAALSDNYSRAVRDFDDTDEPLRDNNGNMWLDPYMPENTEYLKSLITQALNGGFSYIVLDNVCFPCDLGLKTPYYSSVNIADNGETSILLDFLADALGLTGTGQLIVMCDAYGFIDSDAPSERYGGAIYTCGAELFAADARLSCQISDIPDPQGVFTFFEEMPRVFILDVCSTANEAVHTNEHTQKARILACVDHSDGEAFEILSYTGLKDYIIW